MWRGISRSGGGRPQLEAVEERVGNKEAEAVKSVAMEKKEIGCSQRERLHEGKVV